MKRILIMGLPGAGKTTLAQELVKHLDSVEWFNADIVRNLHQDWDFSEVGRLRQAHRMANSANQSSSNRKMGEGKFSFLQVGPHGYDEHYLEVYENHVCHAHDG